MLHRILRRLPGHHRPRGEQHGVLSRRQANAAGLQDHDIARLLRHKELTRVHNGVYVTHTGPLAWMQRAWAAVLFYSPATLCADSALVDGIQLHRITGLARFVQPNRSPSRVRLEHALLDVASRAPSDADAVALLADACQERLSFSRTSPRVPTRCSSIAT